MSNIQLGIHYNHAQCRRISDLVDRSRYTCRLVPVGNGFRVKYTDFIYVHDNDGNTTIMTWDTFRYLFLTGVRIPVFDGVC